MANEVYSEKITTLPFRMIYPVFFKDDAERQLIRNNKKTNNPKDYLEYGVTAVFPLTADLAPLKAAVKKVATEKWKQIPKNIKLPFKNGNSDKDTDKNPYFKDSICIRLSAYEPPKVVDMSIAEVIDKQEVRNGGWARASVVAKTYGGPGTSYQAGVAFKLINVQIMSKSEVEKAYGIEVDDSMISSHRSRPEDDFSVLGNDDPSAYNPAAYDPGVSESEMSVDDWLK